MFKKNKAVETFFEALVLARVHDSSLKEYGALSDTNGEIYGDAEGVNGKRYLKAIGFQMPQFVDSRVTLFWVVGNEKRLREKFAQAHPQLMSKVLQSAFVEATITIRSQSHWRSGPTTAVCDIAAMMVIDCKPAEAAGIVAGFSSEEEQDFQQRVAARRNVALRDELRRQLLETVDNARRRGLSNRDLAEVWDEALVQQMMVT